MDFILPFEIKKRLYEELLSALHDEDNLLGLNDVVSKINFLKQFEHLKNIPSDNNLFNSLYEELDNIISNLSTENSNEILEKFDFIENNLTFKSFIERVVNVRSVSEKNSHIAIITRYLNRYDYFLDLTYPDGYLVYEVSSKNFELYDLPPNEFVFNVASRGFNRNMYSGSFILTPSKWDDYTYSTTFHLFFINEKLQREDIGGIKILKVGEHRTVESIPSTFTKLSIDFCSIFIDDDSYFKLKEMFPIQYISILNALNDMAYFPKNYERYEIEEGVGKSLFRDDKEFEKRIRTIKLKLKYGDLADFFKFDYTYKPLYSDSKVNLKSYFNADKTIPKRIYCLIGKNGVGKTMFLKDLLISFSEKNSQKIEPRIPIYGKVILVSFSTFDFFDGIKNNDDFNFTYCGLINKYSNRPFTIKEIEINLLILLDRLVEKNDLKKYYELISIFIEKKMLEYLFDIDFYPNSFSRDSENKTIRNISVLKNNLPFFLNNLSSGQRALFFIVTELVVNIRYNSLIIFDEPETHLHPNAITEFMELLMDLLEKYDSYSLITTHSPLVVREIFSDSIYVFEKDNDLPRIRRLEFETFGENLSTITEEIFGNKDVQKYYISAIKKLVDKGKFYDDIEEEIRGAVPLNLNLKILIKSLIANRDEESAEI